MSSYTNLQMIRDESQMEVVRRINVNALIQEVGKFPLLYNNTPKQSHTIETKKRIWEKIAERLCGSDQYQEYEELEREAVVREIQLKWKNLKDNYHRILRKEKEDEANGVPPFKRKKYIYYDALEFLKPHAPSSRHSETKEEVELDGGKNSSNIIYINETNDSDEEIVFQTTPPPLTKPLKIQPPPIAPLPTISSFGTLQPVQFIQIPPSSASAKKAVKEEEDNTMGKMSTVLEKIAKNQEQEISDDAMGNKKFLMSLAPFLNKLPDDLNLEVRMQIMAVIQSYSIKEVM